MVGSQRVSLALLMAASAAIAASALPAQPADPIAAYLRCPTDQERAAIDRAFDLRFLDENGWNGYPYACDYADKNPTRAKIYKVLGFLRDVSFSRPLPFTSGKTPDEFLSSPGSGRKLVIVPLTACAATSRGGNFTVVVNAALTRWYPVSSGSPICAEAPLPAGHPGLVAAGVYHPLHAASLLVHEAVHAIAAKPHTAGGSDATIDEMGAWAAQFYYNAWIALYSTNTDARLKQLAKDAAGQLLFSRFTSSFCPSDPALREVVRQIRPRACLDPSERGDASMSFVAIPPGAFTMGCSPGDSSCRPHERPPHPVRITRGFEIGKYEVTQAQWEAVMGWNPSRINGPDYPVDGISWNDVQTFLARLTARNDGYRYRLPTEAEWEYAARAGSTDPFPRPLAAFSWFMGNAAGTPHPVGRREPNAWGLHDMLGNVAEVVQDWYDPEYYSRSPESDPAGPASGKGRVARGSSWNLPGGRFSSRAMLAVPDTRQLGVGFRCVRESAGSRSAGVGERLDRR